MKSILFYQKNPTTKLILQVSRCIGIGTENQTLHHSILSALLLFAIILLTLMAPGLHQLFLNEMEKCRTKK